MGPEDCAVILPWAAEACFNQVDISAREVVKHAKQICAVSFRVCTVMRICVSFLDLLLQNLES